MLNNMCLLHYFFSVYSWIEIRKLWEGLINFISSEELCSAEEGTTEENWPKLAALIRAIAQHLR